MKYHDLIEKANTYYDANERLYFKTIEQLEDVRQDISSIRVSHHLLGIIKPYLIQWGRMGRVVARKDVRWETYCQSLRKLAKTFTVLRHERLRTVNLYGQIVSNAITTIYQTLDPIPYLGSPTTMSKILHILHPELFVMWDTKIRTRYQQRTQRIQSTAQGYLAFLKETQHELHEAFHDRHHATKQRYDVIEADIRQQFDKKTLAKIVDQYNYGLVHRFS